MFLVSSSTLQPQYIDRLIRSAHHVRIFLIKWKQFINRVVARILDRDLVPVEMTFEECAHGVLFQSNHKVKKFFISTKLLMEELSYG
jgi:hypothetical protein